MLWSKLVFKNYAGHLVSNTSLAWVTATTLTRQSISHIIHNDVNFV
jgi:hypothetical protein